MSEFKDRLRKFREEFAKMNKSEFADHIKTKQQYIGWWESGRNKPNIDNLKLIEVAFPKLNMDWLETGNGPILIDTNNTRLISAAKESYNVEMAEIMEKLKKKDQDFEVLREKYDELKERYINLLERVNKLKK